MWVSSLTYLTIPINNLHQSYTKHINHFGIAICAGTLGSITNSHFGDGLNGIAANGSINLSNLTFGTGSSSLLYVSAGGFSFRNKQKEKKQLLMLVVLNTILTTNISV